MEYTFLIVSIVINLFFVFYARWLINIIKTKEEDITNLSILISEYVAHVKGVHEMEMFYGDPTLVQLIQHGTDLVEQIDNFDYLLFDDDEEEEEAEKAALDRE